MTKQHPLTDADCKQIQRNTHDINHPYISYGSSDYGEDPTLLDGLIRAGYDKAIEHSIKWMKENLSDVYLEPFGWIDVDGIIYDFTIDVDGIIYDFRDEFHATTNASTQEDQ